MPTGSLQSVMHRGLCMLRSSRSLSDRNIVVKIPNVYERWVYDAGHARGNPVAPVHVAVY